MNEAKSIIYDLSERPKHLAFLKSRHPVVSMFGGYGSAKTFFACVKAHIKCLYYPGNRVIVGRKTYPALQRSTLKTYLEEVAIPANGGSLNPGPVIARFVSSPIPKLFYVNGSEVEFVTLDDVKKIRGPEVGDVVIDQCEEILRDIYLELIGRARYWNETRIREYLASDFRKKLEESEEVAPVPFNQVIVVGNPAPNWVKEEFYENPKKLNECYQVSTEENRKYLPKDYIENLIARYPKDWVDRFVKGDWNVFGGQVFPEFNYEGLHKIPRMVIPSHWPRIIGWDHGRINPTAIEVGAIDPHGNLIAYKEHYQGDTAPEDHAIAFKHMAIGDFFPLTDSGKFLVHMDYSVKGNYDASRERKSVWDHYNELGIYGMDAIKDVHAGILLMQRYLHPNPERIFPPWYPRAGQPGSPAFFIMDGECPNLVHETQIYQWQESDEDGISPEMPKKVSDHAVDAWRYMCQAANKIKALEPEKPKPIEQWAREQELHLAMQAFVREDPFAQEEES